LDKHHGQATGIFTCDEHLAGRSPSQGTELCTVVEAMYSLEALSAVTGDARLGDRLEKLAFNALPAAFKKDMTAHQYDQQCNQVICTKEGEHVYVNNGPDSNLYGLEPNFGCCTANLHQGWPKLSKALWRATRDGGLAAFVYAPNILETTLPAGARVRIETVTEYPFQETILLRIEPDAPTRFPLKLRIPAWCDGASVTTSEGVRSDLVSGSWTILDRSWSAGDSVELKLPMKIHVSFWYKNSAGVELGPLILALKIHEQWYTEGGYPTFPDWSIK